MLIIKQQKFGGKFHAFCFDLGDPKTCTEKYEPKTKLFLAWNQDFTRETATTTRASGWVAVTIFSPVEIKISSSKKLRFWFVFFCAVFRVSEIKTKRMKFPPELLLFYYEHQNLTLIWTCFWFQRHAKSPKRHTEHIFTIPMPSAFKWCAVRLLRIFTRRDSLNHPS